MSNPMKPLRDFSDLHKAIEALRPDDADYIILSVGVRAPNYDCPDGNGVVTIRMGYDEATSEAVHISDAVALARGKIIKAREAEKKAKAEAKEKASQ
jgi:hypothetical protein